MQGTVGRVCGMCVLAAQQARLNPRKPPPQAAAEPRAAGFQSTWFCDPTVPHKAPLWSRPPSPRGTCF